MSHCVKSQWYHIMLRATGIPSCQKWMMFHYAGRQSVVWQSSCAKSKRYHIMSGANNVPVCRERAYYGNTHYAKSQQCPIVSSTIIWSEHPIVPRARGVPCCGEPMYCQNVLFSHEPTICHCPRSHLSVELSLYAGSQQYSIVPGISMFSKWPIISGASNVPLS